MATLVEQTADLANRLMPVQFLDMKRIEDIRRDNARTLAKQAGGQSAMASKIGKSQAFMSQLIGENPVRNIGPTVAREIEQHFGLPPGWLDTDHERGLSLSAQELAERFDQLSVTEKQRLEPILAHAIGYAVSNPRTERYIAGKTGSDKPCK